MTIVSLGTHIADSAKRMAHVLAASAAMKANMGEMESLMSSDFRSLGLPRLMAGLSSRYAKWRVADRIPTIASLCGTARRPALRYSEVTAVHRRTTTTATASERPGSAR